jgi:pimeloyl-ACP methyl ester carboxylesterase
MNMEAEDIEVRLGDGKFATTMRRAGRGEPLVFLHGAGGPLSGAAFLDDLARTFTVYAPAHPGFGPGEGVEHLDDVLDFTLYYLDFLEAIGVAKAHLVGHSLGGMLAAEIAALAPSVVDRLVLVCPAGLWLDSVPIPDFFTFTPEQLVKSALHDPNGPVGKALLEQFRDPNLALESYRCLASAGKFMWPIPDKGLKKRIHRVKAPTLIVWGASDGLIPTAYADAFAAAIPGSLAKILNGAGHLPMLEQREAFVEAVGSFLLQ